MVLGSVPDDQGVLAPPTRLLVELSDEISDEQADCVAVGVGSGEGHVAVTVVGEGEDHADARLPQPLRKAIS